MTKENMVQTEEIGKKLLNKPLPHVLNEMEWHIETVEDAAKRAEAAAKIAKEIEERLSKAEEALVKAVIKRLTRSDWILILVVINLAIVFAAVLFAVAIASAI
jgi:hypothetical protein